VRRAGASGCGSTDQAIAGHVASTRTADVWTFTPERRLEPGDYCVQMTTDVYDFTGRNLPTPFSARVRVSETGR
jgi:hypothetical protein